MIVREMLAAAHILGKCGRYRVSIQPNGTTAQSIGAPLRRRGHVGYCVAHCHPRQKLGLEHVFLPRLCMSRDRKRWLSNPRSNDEYPLTNLRHTEVGRVQNAVQGFVLHLLKKSPDLNSQSAVLPVMCVGHHL